MKFQNVKRISLLWLILVFCLLTSCKQPETFDSQGHPIRVSDYNGKWVVIHYWASWCAQCMTEIPVLNNLVQYYNNQVVVLGVNFDHLSNSTLQELKQSYGINYPILGNFPIEHWGVKEIPVIPVTFIINPQGKLQKTLLGPQTLQNFQTEMNLPPISLQ